MNTTARTILAFAGALALGACKERSQSPASAEAGESSAAPSNDTNPAPSPARSPVAAADNTSRNARDARGNALTPFDQGLNTIDVKISAGIRSTIVADHAMSFNAQNVKIITKDGVVTLRGPVDSLVEKDNIEAVARSTLGVVRVDNELEVRFP